MRPKYTIRIVLLALAISGGFLVLRSSGSQPGGSTNGGVQESMEDCCKKPVKSSNMNWENLSQQFFSAL